MLKYLRGIVLLRINNKTRQKFMKLDCNDARDNREWLEGRKEEVLLLLRYCGWYSLCAV